MPDLVARKRLTYAGRVRLPGVVFSARPEHASVLVAVGVAGFAPEPKPVAPEPQPAVSGVVCVDYSGNVEFMRATYFERTGRKADKRWGAARLRKEIEAL